MGDGLASALAARLRAPTERPRPADPVPGSPRAPDEGLADELGLGDDEGLAEGLGLADGVGVGVGVADVA